MCSSDLSKVLKLFARINSHVPLITVVKGKNYGMLSYLARMSTLCIGYDKAQMSTTSPLLLSATNGGKDCSSVLDVAKFGSFTNIVKNDAEAKSLITNTLNLLCYPDVDTDDDANRVCKGLGKASSMSSVVKEIFDKGTIDGYTVAAIDGTKLFGSYKKSCNECCTTTARNKKTNHFHSAAFMSIVGSEPRLVLDFEL